MINGTTVFLSSVLALTSAGPAATPAPQPFQSVAVQSQDIKNDAKDPEHGAGTYERTPRNAMFAQLISAGQTKVKESDSRKERDDRAKNDWWSLFFLGASAVFTGLLVTVGVIQSALFLWQLRLIAEQGRITRDQFNATHRPKMRVRFVKGPDPVDADRWLFRAYIANVGDGPAIIKSARLQLLQRVDGKDVSVELAVPTAGPITIEIGAGLTIQQKAVDFTIFDSVWHAPLTLQGRVIYEDRSGNSRITSFSRERLDSQSKWRISETYPEDEYED